MSVTDLLIKMKPKRRPTSSLDSMQSPLLGKQSGSISINRRELRRVVILVSVVSLTLLAFGFLFQNHFLSWPERISLPLIKRPAKEAEREKVEIKNAMKRPAEPTYRVEMQLTDNPSTVIHKRNTLMDVCRIMPQCFGHSKTFGDLKSCQDGISLTMEHYDSGILIETAPGGQEEVVGFLSALPVRRENQIFIFFYNVCIDSSRRRKGLAKKLLSEFVEKYVSITNWPRDRIFLALDVDLRAPVAVGALSLYIKLGFVRWMEPCKNVYENEVSRAIRPPHNTRPLHNLAAIFADPKGYAKRWYQPFDPSHPSHKKGEAYPTHFCMYKKLEDSFDGIGKALVASVADLDTRFPNMVIPDDE